MKNVPDTHLDLLKDDKKAFAFIATTMDEGSPQLTPVWFQVVENTILINTTKGRTKYRNLVNRSAVAVVIMAMDNPYHYLQIRGKVVAFTEDGAEDQMNSLSQKYQGKNWTFSPGNQRVVISIQPEKIFSYSWNIHE